MPGKLTGSRSRFGFDLDSLPRRRWRSMRYNTRTFQADAAGTGRHGASRKVQGNWTGRIGAWAYVQEFIVDCFGGTAIPRSWTNSRTRQ